MNFIRGETVKGDIFRIDFETKKISLLATALAWGFASKVIESSENWRGCLGVSRYTICGTKEILWAGGPWKMTVHELSKVQLNQNVDICNPF